MERRRKAILIDSATVFCTTVGWGILWLGSEDISYGSEFFMNSLIWTTKLACHNNSNYVKKFKTTPTYIDLQGDIGNSIKKKWNSFTWSLDSLDVFSKITLWKYNYTVTVINQDVRVKITDTYDFNKEKDDNSYMHTYLNILHDSQEQGILTPYKVEVNLNYSIWK